MERPVAPALKYVLRIRIDVGDPIDLGMAPAGHRRLVPITGGTFDGPDLTSSGGRALRGRVLPGGADDQRLVSPTLTELDASYALETNGGARIAIRNTGIRVGAAADIYALTRGEQVAPERIYFRCQPRFTTADSDLAWLNERLFVARGVRTPDAVALEVFRVD